MLTPQSCEWLPFHGFSKATRLSHLHPKGPRTLIRSQVLFLLLFGMPVPWLRTLLPAHSAGFWSKELCLPVPPCAVPTVSQQSGTGHRSEDLRSFLGQRHWLWVVRKLEVTAKVKGSVSLTATKQGTLKSALSRDLQAKGGDRASNYQISCAHPCLSCLLTMWNGQHL